MQTLIIININTGGHLLILYNNSIPNIDIKHILVGEDKSRHTLSYSFSVLKQNTDQQFFIGLLGQMAEAFSCRHPQKACILVASTNALTGTNESPNGFYHVLIGETKYLYLVQMPVGKRDPTGIFLQLTKVLDNKWLEPGGNIC